MRPPPAALWHSVVHGDEKSVRELLTAGADVKAQHGAFVRGVHVWYNQLSQPD